MRGDRSGPPGDEYTSKRLRHGRKPSFVVFCPSTSSSNLERESRHVQEPFEPAKLSSADGCVGGRGGGRRASQPRARRPREGTQHLLLGGIQLRRRARSLPPRVRRQGSRRGPDLRPRRGQPAARGGDRGVGPHQREQPVGARDDVPGRAHPAAAAGTLRADVREDDARLPSPLHVGDGQVGRGAARHDPALRPLQLRRQHRQDLEGDGGGRRLQRLLRLCDAGEVRCPHLRQLEHLPHVRRPRACTPSSRTPRKSSRRSPGPAGRSSTAPRSSPTTSCR